MQQTYRGTKYCFMNKYLLLSVFLSISLSVFAQKPRIKFEKLSVEDGMSQSSVLSIIRDSQGFMWFATLDGLNKYDGYNFKIYRADSETEKSVTDNIINVLYETSDFDLWIGTAANGLCKYDRLNDNFDVLKYSDNTDNSLSNNNINDIAETPGCLWIATDKGLNKYIIKDRKFIHFFYNESNNSLSSDTVLCVDTDKNGNVWAGTKSGFNLINTKHNTVKKFNYFNENTDTYVNDITAGENKIWIATTKGLFVYYVAEDKLLKLNLKKNTDKEQPVVNKLIKDTDNILWVGTENDGLIRLNTRNYTFYKYKHDPVDSQSLSTNTIKSLYIDKSGILWVGTSLGGVSKWNRAAEDIDVFRHNPYNEQSLSAPQVRCFYVDKDNDIWVGTVEGGLNKWDKKNDKFYHYKHNPDNDNSISHNHIRSILQDYKGRFWVATDGGGLNLFDKSKGTFKHYKKDEDISSISSNRVWKIYEDKKHNLWIGTFGGGLNLFNPERGSFKAYRHSETDTTSISSDLVTSIFEDRGNRLWIGTFSGLNLFNTEKETFERYTNDKSDPESISNDRVYCINEDIEGFLWIGTKGGLNKFDVKNQKFTRFTVKNSDLPNDVILGITEDGNYLWISTNNGICRMNKKTYEIKTFDVGDGLQSNEFLAGAYYRKKDGEILFGGIDGFNAFYPEKIKDNPHKPPILITGFQVSNQYLKTDTIISSKKQIILDHTENDISFDFVALDFIFPQKNKYKYILEGNDNEWTNAGYRRYAKYTNLKPGSYIFRVIGSNNDDVWNEKGASLRIIIKPAFWQTLWFKILFISFIFLLVLLIYKIRVRAIKKRNEELENEVKRRTAEIRQQNKEIKAQRDEIVEQKKEITDSILYAERIQRAALPTSEYISENIPEHFILFKPRDIVSGDFYWVSKKENKIIVTAVDCTGHGVPGAFMSMLGISFLNKIVNERNITDSAEILNRLRANIINALHPEGYEIESKDGMDMALCVIDTEKNTIDFSGAYNPMFHWHKGKITEIKADRMPVAKYDIVEDFTKKTVKFNAGDAIYLFSDGYPDQFGGYKHKKFMKGKLRRLLEETGDKPMQEQKQILEDTLEKWMNNQPQIDDIVIVGVRL